MKRIVFTLFCLGSIFSSVMLFAMAKKDKDIPSSSTNEFNDQVDQTDIYAIPLDNSEEEERLEMEQLQKEQQRQNPRQPSQNIQRQRNGDPSYKGTIPRNN